MEKKKVLYYVNQFFGQIGGEEKAHTPPLVKEEAVGPAMAFKGALKDEIDLVATFICGDNYINEHSKEALVEFEKAMDKYKPDIVVLGPSFNAGRYGVATAIIAEFVKEKYDLPMVSGCYEENPGLDQLKKFAYTVKTGNSAADMKKAIPSMAKLVKKLVVGEEIDPSVDDYFLQGRRLTIFSDRIGAKRAVDMLLTRFKNEPYTTELPMPTFDLVEIAKAVKDIKKARIALVTSGGIVPEGNPDKIQSASAQKWGKYNIKDLKELKGSFITIHGGYDPVYANEISDRVVPLDVLRNMEEEGLIGEVYEYFYTTTGTGTSVANAVRFGKEIGKELKDAGVDGVILTST